MRRVRRNGPWAIPEPLDGGRGEKMKHHSGGNWVHPRHVKTPAGELDPEPPTSREPRLSQREGCLVGICRERVLWPTRECRACGEWRDRRSGTPLLHPTSKVSKATQWGEERQRKAGEGNMNGARCERVTWKLIFIL